MRDLTLPQAPMAAQAEKRAGAIQAYATLNLVLFFARDGFTGVLRLGLDRMGAGLIWFLPDIMAFGAVLLFTLDQARRRSGAGLLLVAIILWSSGIGVLFMNRTALSFIASLKMMLPIFTGLLFSNRSALEGRAVRWLLLAILVAMIGGVLLDPYVDYVEQDSRYQTFGAGRMAAKLWWQEGAARLGGFAGDSALSAALILFLLALLAPWLRRWAFIFLVPLAFAAIWLTDSKTAMIGLITLLCLWPWMAAKRAEAQATTMLGALAVSSFGLALAAPLIMLFFAMLPPEQTPAWMASLADRALNSWVAPFQTVAAIFPPGLFLGCGLGCFANAMDYTALAALHAPLDNFYLTSLIMMGYPFLAFIVAVMPAVGRVKDRGKLCLIILFNLYGVTIQAYAPSALTLIFGYMLSGALAKPSSPAGGSKA